MVKNVNKSLVISQSIVFNVRSWSTINELMHNQANKTDYRLNFSKNFVISEHNYSHLEQ